MNERLLKYGCNPHQKPARLYMKKGELPFEVLNGTPGYINFLDAFNSWQLVKELKEIFNLPAAASFKHVSPAGAAIAIPMSEELKKACFVDDLELSPVAIAYARARGADRMSSFGDWIAISDTVDESLATLIKREVSDGIIAPDYTKEALDILKTKQNGRYNIVKIDSNYEPEDIETREVYGITFEQKRNNIKISSELLNNIVTENKNLTENARRDLLISLVTLKYTQSNSVCFAYDGQVIGCGAGQQSRIHCTRLAASKADIWFLRQHPKVLSLEFKDGIGKPEKANAIDQFLRDDITEAEIKDWKSIFKVLPERLTKEEKEEWLKNFTEVSLGSDAFFPFRDNIDRAHKSGVKYVAQPGGSVRDDVVINAANEYRMVMCFTGVRLFHH
ncbi:MAG: phosphoribosylaminoimidazolecarboxamide formyltransferase [Brevinematales bacterium]|nr:phosphoribosylaminoimidazolecarboxamide formyltransferase [Brevinematales bacterium]